MKTIHANHGHTNLEPAALELTAWVEDHGDYLYRYAIASMKPPKEATL